MQNFSRQIQVLQLAIAFRDFGVLAVLYENRKSCLTFLLSKSFSLFCFGSHGLGI
jgi:hypothetical protein